MPTVNEIFLLVTVDTSTGFCEDVTAMLNPMHKSKGTWHSIQDLEAERRVTRSNGELWDLTLLTRIPADGDILTERIRKNYDMRKLYE